MTHYLGKYTGLGECLRYTLQQTVDHVKLPDSLVNQANLQEFYGSVACGVRSIFFHYVGWFDGNPTNLYPLSSRQEAKNMIELAGGEKKKMHLPEIIISRIPTSWRII